jgi:hypothetical protein
VAARICQYPQHLPGVVLTSDATALTDELAENWSDSIPRVVLVEGFPGVGKSRVGREVVDRWPGLAVRVEVPEDFVSIEDVLLDVATRFDELGDEEMSSLEDLDLLSGLLRVMRKGALLVIDDVQRLLDPSTGIPQKELRRLVEKVASAEHIGRLLLLSNQAPADGLWLEKVRRVVLGPPTAGVAESFLDQLLIDRGLAAQIPVDQRSSVVKWLGGNPRAITALVACLMDQTLDQLIEMEPDAWQLRDEVVSPQLIQKLETYFLSRTLDQLDSNALLLLEALSVYRKPFRADAIDRLSRIVSDPASAREALSSRYLLEMHGAYLSLHPIIRRLARVRLSQNPRREHNAHTAASDHFVRRLRPTSSTPINLATAGEAFVEARYHLLVAGRQSEFEKIASDHRRQLLSHYRLTTTPPSSATARRQLLVTLLAALSAGDSGFAPLRILLARLLLERGQPDDDLQALRQLVQASRESKDVWCWRTRIDLTVKLEGLPAGKGVSVQALSKLHASNHWMPYYRYAASLIGENRQVSDAEALSWLNESFDRVPANSLYGLYGLASFILCRRNRRTEALELLLTAVDKVGTNSGNSWRLLEEAAYVAAATGASEPLHRVRIASFEHEKAAALTTLCDVLLLLNHHRYSQAVEKSTGNTSPALVSQSVFAALCSGDVVMAEQIMATAVLPRNKASSWLKSLVALCSRKSDLYAEEISHVVGRRLSDEELADPGLWLRVWDDIPSRVEAYPAFYFYRLPAALTGLDSDLVRLPEGESQLPLVDLQRIKLPTVLEPVIADDKEETNFDATPPLINVEGNLIMSGDSYNISGQAGAVGPGSQAANNTFNQVVGQMSPDEFGSLAVELGRLRSSMRSAASTPEEDMAVAEIARAEVAANSGDTAEMGDALSKAGKWALATANSLGVGLAVAALKAAIGM